MGGQGGLGHSHPGAGKCLAGGIPIGQCGQGLPGVPGPPGTELGDGQVRHCELGDIASRIGGQVPFQQPDGLGVSAGLDVFLAEEELGVGGDRAAGQLGKPGEDRLGLGGTPEGLVRQGQLITGLRQGGRGEGRRRCVLRVRRRFEERFEEVRRREVVSGHRRGSGLNQPDIGTEWAPGKSASELAGKFPGRRRIAPIQRSATPGGGHRPPRRRLGPARRRRRNIASASGRRLQLP